MEEIKILPEDSRLISEIILFDSINLWIYLSQTNRFIFKVNFKMGVAPNRSGVTGDSMSITNHILTLKELIINYLNFYTRNLDNERNKISKSQIHNILQYPGFMDTLAGNGIDINLTNKDLRLIHLVSFRGTNSQILVNISNYNNQYIRELHRNICNITNQFIKDINVCLIISDYYLSKQESSADFLYDRV